MRSRVLFLLAVLAAQPAMAEDAAAPCGPDDTLPALVRCAAEAAAMLPGDKRDRLRTDIDRTAELAAGTGDAAARRDTAYPDYGWQAAKSVLETGGPEALLKAARDKAGPLRFGRAEALLAAGIRAAGFSQDEAAARALAEEDGLAERINETLMTLARGAGDFEKGDLAHSAARLAALRCDAARFEAARSMTLAPDAVRYAFWEARVKADRSALPGVIMSGASAEETGPVRQALDGIEFLAEYGLCQSPDPAAE